MGNSEVTEIEYHGKKFYMAFTLNVMQDFQAEYGNINVLFSEVEKCQKDPMSVNMKMFIDLFRMMFVEGAEMHNEDTGEEVVAPTQRQAGRIVQSMGLGKAGALFATMVKKSTDTGEDRKNA
jgi:hypothetical protein